MTNKGCACTPRSLLVPAGGVNTLDPSLRVSNDELMRRDREWKKLGNTVHGDQKPDSKCAKAQSSPAMDKETLSRPSDSLLETSANTRGKKKGLISSLLSKS